MDAINGVIAHSGQVRRIVDGRALVAVETSGCSSCGHAGGCGIGKLAGSRRETLISLPAQPGLSVGELVTLELSERQVTRAALMGYLLPAVFLIVGALIGEKVGSGGTAPPDGLAAFGALVGLTLGLLLARLGRPVLPHLTSFSVSPLENPHV